ncbi:DNA-directed RNA polymerase subunit alpha [Candidatus Peregrinibacteria bacterium]|nr:DNA-directed RNA polymerase subunit alpha [Candidatus Peregrinibacteria bacterium]
MHIIQEEIGPPKLSFQSLEDSRGQFTLSPLPSGFGHTVGNSLRRVLLSSIPGAGITAIKVKGATHEYASLPGMKDTVLDLILNLKQVHFKKHTSEMEIVTLEKKGTGPVTAKDIKTSSDIDILNPDQVITTLEGKNSALSLEIRIEKGVGYLPVKDRLKNEEDAEWILVDAAFSPVLAVKYEVASTRVGEMTNLDKLEIEIKTDGSLSPEECVRFSAELLKNYFSIFTAQKEDLVEPDFIADFSKTKPAEAIEEGPSETYTPIEILNLSPRTLNALINGDIGSIEELTQCSLAKLSTLRGFGKKAQDEVIAALENRGLSLTEE